MDNITDRAKRAADVAGETHSERAEDLGQKIQDNPAYRTFVTVGLLAYGLVHVVIAAIALGIAWGGGGEASSSGALESVDGLPGGPVLLIVCAVGLAALVIWQAIEAAVGNNHVSGSKRLRKRLSSAAKVVVYGTLAFSAARLALTAGGSSGGDGTESLTSMLLGVPGGRILVMILGLTVIGVGIYHVVKGVKRKFKIDLDSHVPEWAMRLGQVGYTAKGTAIGIVGILFAWAAIRHDPDAAGGTNSALRALMEQPFGPFILSAVALGLLAFGAYCGVWAFNARHEADSDDAN